MIEDKHIISVEYLKIATVVKLMYEEILSDADVDKLEASIMPLVLEREGQNLVLDFTNVRTVSSSLLGFLLTLRKHISQRSGRLTLCCIKDKVKSAASDTYVHEIFKIVKLDKIFKIFSNVTEALNHLDKN